MSNLCGVHMLLQTDCAKRDVRAAFFSRVYTFVHVEGGTSGTFWPRYTHLASSPGSSSFRACPKEKQRESLVYLGT